MEGVSHLLTGHRVIVTGAGSGIGRAVASRFAADGAEVVASDLVRAEGVAACDVCDQDSVRTLFAEALATGPVTDVVHCAGVGAVGPLQEVELPEWSRVIGVNLTGAFIVGREAARTLRRGSTFTFMASAGGLRGEAMHGVYSASKFGVLGLMQAMAREMAPQGIRVNAVCPGIVDTPMTDTSIEREAAISGRSVDEIRRSELSQVPLAEIPTAEQVADVCVFLASALASHVAGASIVVNGAR
jgi:NAD(P)-dependent dehydrogenase (short-subunit alcohol dehydrogenase family)